MRNPDRETSFRFKQFVVANHRSAMKVGTDGVLLGAWAAQSRPAEATSENNRLRILDIGSGTGLIALMLAQRFPTASITGVEIDPIAAEEASSNFNSSPWADRLRIIIGDICSLTAERLGGRFDIIVSNPPFFSNGVLSPETTRQQARHESTLSLENLLMATKSLLKENGSLYLILPADREQDLKYYATISKLALSRLVRVKTTPSKPAKRILAELSNTLYAECAESQLIIREAHKFSNQYSNLVKDFYLNF